MEQNRILVVDDERDLCDILLFNLHAEGFQADAVYSAEEALQLRIADYDLLLLDVMMPGMSGFELAKRLKRHELTWHIPVIFLTAKDSEDDTLEGFSIGADDYVTKPFSPSELMARVDVLYRRVEMGRNDAARADSRRVCGDFVLDLRARTLQKRGVPIELTQVEFQMMEFFFENAGAALTRADILRRVWGAEYYGEEKIVDVNVRRLRMKLEDDPSVPHYLQTVWGVGYRWLG